MTFGGWNATRYADPDTMQVVAHVIHPIGDLRPHVLPDSEQDGPCWCNPTEDVCDLGTITVHHALDGREAFETGERQVS